MFQVQMLTRKMCLDKHNIPIIYHFEENIQQQVNVNLPKIQFDRSLKNNTFRVYTKILFF